MMRMFGLSLRDMPIWLHSGFLGFFGAKRPNIRFTYRKKHSSEQVFLGQSPLSGTCLLVEALILILVDNGVRQRRETTLFTPMFNLIEHVTLILHHHQSPRVIKRGQQCSCKLDNSNNLYPELVVSSSRQPSYLSLVIISWLSRLN